VALRASILTAMQHCVCIFPSNLLHGVAVCAASLLLSSSSLCVAVETCEPYMLTWLKLSTSTPFWCQRGSWGYLNATLSS